MATSEYRNTRKNFKKAYKSIMPQSPFDEDPYKLAHNIVAEGVDDYLDLPSSRRMSDIEVRALARRVMEDAEEYSDIGMALDAASLYIGLEKSDIGVSKLKNALETISKKGKVSKREYEKVMTFIKKNSGREMKSGALEGRLGIFILSSVAGIALTISSLNATGNVISNLTGTMEGLGGLTLFVIGIAGLVFGRE